MNYWLMKTEPGTYSWDDLVKDKKTIWDGVRNYQARNNLKAMKKGDIALFYHSGEDKAIIGTAKISKESFPDPKDKNWMAVEITIERKLKKPITLAEVKSEKQLSNMALVRSSRLSVQPVRDEEMNLLIKMSNSK